MSDNTGPKNDEVWGALAGSGATPPEPGERDDECLGLEGDEEPYPADDHELGEREAAEQ